MKKLFKTLFLVFILSSSALQAAFEPKGLGVPYLAAGGTGRAAELQPFAVFLNPSTLSQIQSSSINLYYKNYYQLESLNLMALEARFRPFGIPLGIGVSRYGNAQYQEADVRIGTAVRFLDEIDLGISLNLYSVYLKNFGNSTTTGFSIAALWSVVQSLHWSVVVENLNEPELGTAKEKIPMLMILSQRWQIISNLALFTDIVKEQDYDFDTRWGISYRPILNFKLYAGFRTLTPIYSAGFSTVVGVFQLGYAFEYHVELGGSHSIGAGYVF